MDILSEAKRKYEEMTSEHRQKYEELRSKLRSTPQGEKYYSETADIWIKANTGSLTPDEAEKQASKLHRDFSAFLKKQGYENASAEYSPLCDKCSDTGFHDGKMCDCFKRFVAEECRNFSCIAANASDESFENFDMDLFTGDGRKLTESAYRQCLAFAESFGTGSENLLISGKTGSGKSYLAHCIAKKLLDEGKTVLYKTAFALMEDITRYTIGQENSSVYNFIFSCELLIIDDLGTERLTDFTEMQLYNILQERQNARKPIVITTNLTMSEIKNIYGERINSRLAGGFKGLHTQQDDLRLKKKIMAVKNN